MSLQSANGVLLYQLVHPFHYKFFYFTSKYILIASP